MEIGALRLIACSWPRPVIYVDREWLSLPEWEAPAMARLPEWHEHVIDGAVCQLIDWRQEFTGGLDLFGSHMSGEMKGFHVVFRLRAERSGVLIFFDDDGTIVRQNGTVVHEDRQAHPLTRHALPVRAGDQLEIAQWQYHGDWMWAGAIQSESERLDRDVALFAPYLPRVEQALLRPNGPVLKTYCAAAEPVRSALCVYSMILNGYRPAAVQVYGEGQWDARRRAAVQSLLPFAEIVPTWRVEQALAAHDRRLLAMARQTWSAMKIAVALFLPPFEYCLLDDDIFVLDRMDDALDRFATHDLVYAPDWNHDFNYRRIWLPDRAEPLPSGNVNTGLYLARNRRNPALQIQRLLKTPPDGHQVWLWEQGFVASEFADDPISALPSQRYFYPYFDGLPGGVLGYDWRANPCGFATVHFGGLRCKPDDDVARTLAADILGRNRIA
jgi:hypothetical protein